ncbi:MAG: DUF1523 family protein [Silicimonas sp.]|nr:DUF1523 family protein [Silicimonas sp.]
MTYIRWTFRILLLLIVGGFLHYTLPQRDIVRVVNTYEERQDYGGWTKIFWSNPAASSAENATQDVLFIQTVKANGKVMVYRNEDTSWGWPPYFKFDTANLQTEAADGISPKEAPEWYAVRHYGWRNTWLSIFPNALSIRAVDGPDTRLIPWFNIVFLTILFLICATIWRLWRNFRQARIDPVFDDIDESVDAMQDRAGGFFDRLYGRLFGRKK